MAWKDGLKRIVEGGKKGGGKRDGFIFAWNKFHSLVLRYSLLFACPRQRGQLSYLFILERNLDELWVFAGHTSDKKKSRRHL